MSEFDIFLDEEKLLLASALYKTGVWISYAEDLEGEEDDIREMRALGACLRAVAKKYEGPGLVDDIARFTLSQKDVWEEWADDVYDPRDEIGKALALMKNKAPKDDLKKYKAALYEVAVTVAQAHGEFIQYDEEEPEESSAFGALLGKITATFLGKGAEDADHPMNVSSVESQNISQLKTLMREYE